MKNNIKIQEPKAFINNLNLMSGNVEYYQKQFKDIKKYYLNSDGYSDIINMYEVYSFENEIDNSMSLNYGLTVLHAIDINQECNFTRGHVHENMDCAEIYVCSEGQGLLLLMDNNECNIEKMYPGSIHYISGKYAHRLVNIGDCDLKVYATWSPKAGHDYKKTESCPFKYRIFKIEGEVTIKEI